MTGTDTAGADAAYTPTTTDHLVDDPLLERLTPELDPLMTPFWTGGAHGQLKICRCHACGTYAHPPTSHCPRCLRRAMEPTAVSGRGTVLTYTVNYQQWIPGQPPYTLAIVGLEEQPDVRITSVLVDIAPEDVEIDLPVEVRFVHRNDVFYPVFVPRRDGGRTP
jgi:uncharacterized OB-fold protein